MAEAAARLIGPPWPVPASNILSVVDEIRRGGCLEQHQPEFGRSYSIWFAPDAVGPGFCDTTVRAAWTAGLLAGGDVAPSGRKRVTLKPEHELADALARVTADYDRARR